MCKISRQAEIYIVTEAIYGISMGMYGFALNFFFLSVSLDTVQIGMLTSVGIVVMGMCALPFGAMARRWGRRNVYANGVLLIGFNIVAYSICPVRFFFLPTLMIAAGMTMVEVSEIQVMYQSCESEQEKILVYSVAFAAFSLSSAVGALLAGWIPCKTGYAGTLFLSGIITVFVGIIRWRMLDADIPGEERKTRISVQILHRVVDYRFLAFLGVVAVHSALSNTIAPFANLILKYRCDWQDGEISIVVTMSHMVGFLFALYTPRLQRKMYESKRYLVVYGLSFACTLGMAVPANKVLFVLFYLARWGLEIMLKNMIDSIAFLTLESYQKDLYAGARSLTKGLVGAATTFAVGVLLNQGEIEKIFLLSAMLILCAIGVFVLGVTPILKMHTKGAVYHDSIKPF